MKKTLLTILGILVAVVVVLVGTALFIMPKGEMVVPYVASTTPQVTVATKTSSIKKTKTGTVTPTKTVYETVISQKNDNSTISVRRGTRVIMQLGTFDWVVTVSDPSVLSRAQVFQNPVGVEGFYDAHKAGTVVVRGTGKPKCESGKACVNTISTFKTTVIVR